MEEMTVLSALTLFPETKSQQDSFVEKLIAFVDSGECDPLKVEAQMANIEMVVKKYRSDKRVNDILLSEAERYGKSFEHCNAKFEVKETGTKYNYGEVGHAGYNAVCAEIERLDAKRKEYEMEIKCHKAPWIFTDPETGEISEVSPAAKQSTTKLVTTINK